MAKKKNPRNYDNKKTSVPLKSQTNNQLKKNGYYRDKYGHIKKSRY